jgi:hypothetical protein
LSLLFIQTLNHAFLGAHRETARVDAQLRYGVNPTRPIIILRLLYARLLLTQMQKFRAILMAGPLGQAVIDVDNPLVVEDVAGGFECRRDFRNMTEVEQGRKREPHSAPFIGDQRSTAPAADFARKESLMPEVFSVDESEGFEPLR